MKKVPVFLSLLLLLAGIICAFIYFLPVETESKCGDQNRDRYGEYSFLMGVS